PPHHRKEPGVEVGHDPQLESLITQPCQHGMGFRKQYPGARIFKHLKDLLEEFIKPLEHSDAIKHVVYDVEPPEPLTLLQLDRIRCGKNRGRRVVKGTLKTLRNR